MRLRSAETKLNRVLFFRPQMPTHLKVDADVEPLLDIFQKVAIGFGAARNVDLEMTVPRTTFRQSHQLSENEKSEETDILVEQHFSELV